MRLAAKGRIPDDASLQTSRDQQMVPRTELGADDEVLVVAEAAAHLHHCGGASEVLHALGELAAVFVQRQESHPAAERGAHEAPVR